MINRANQYQLISVHSVCQTGCSAWGTSAAAAVASCYLPGVALTQRIRWPTHACVARNTWWVRSSFNSFRKQISWYVSHLHG